MKPTDQGKRADGLLSPALLTVLLALLFMPKDKLSVPDVEWEVAPPGNDEWFYLYRKNGYLYGMTRKESDELFADFYCANGKRGET